MEILEIVSEVEKCIKGMAKNVLITGGEPLMQKKPFIALCLALSARGYSIQVETGGQYPIPNCFIDNAENPGFYLEFDELSELTGEEQTHLTGIVYDGDIREYFDRIGFVVDIKMPGSGQSAKMLGINIESYVQYHWHIHKLLGHTVLNIKFVVNDGADIQTALSLILGYEMAFDFLFGSGVAFLFSPTPELCMSEVYRIVSQSLEETRLPEGKVPKIVFSKQIHKLIHMP